MNIRDEDILVSIILVNYNTCELTKSCIDSIYKNTKDIAFEIIVVDNASIDNSIKYLSNENRIKLIKSQENIGFGKGNNLGYSKAKGKYLFLLNTDTILLNNALKYFLMEYNKLGDNVGCIGCKLQTLEGTYNSSYSRFLTIGRILKEQIRRYLNLPPTWSEENAINQTPFEVDMVVGADLFLNKSIADKYGLFDENFFMYHEENDMQRTYNKNGLKNYIVDGPKIVHLQGASSKSNIRRKILGEQGKFVYLKKWNPFMKYLIFRFIYFFIKIPFLFNKDFTVKDKLRYFVQIAIK